MRKGAEKVSDRRPGTDLDHFRFTSDRPEVEEAFREAYGDKPVLINCYLLHPTVEGNFECWKEAWSAGGLQHRCDGEVCVLWLKPDGTYTQEPRPCPGGCKEVGRLSVIIPELVMAGFVGAVTVETHSKHDIMSIQASLQAAALQRVDNQNGLKGIHWVLRRQPEMVSAPAVGKEAEKGGRVRRQKWLISLEPAAEWMQVQIRAARAVAMLEASRVELPLLTTPSGETFRAEEIQSSAGDPQEPVDEGGISEDMEEPTTSRSKLIEDIRAGWKEIGFENVEGSAEWAYRFPGRTLEDLDDAILGAIMAKVRLEVDKRLAEAGKQS